MFNFSLFLANVIFKFYNAFTIHKAIEKQASMTKIHFSGIFGIFSHTLTQLILEAQDNDNNTDDSDNSSHENHNNNTIKRKNKTTKDQALNIYIHQTFIIDNDNDNNVHVDTNYKHYRTTVRGKRKEYN